MRIMTERLYHLHVILREQWTGPYPTGNTQNNTRLHLRSSVKVG